MPESPDEKAQRRFREMEKFGRRATANAKKALQRLARVSPQLLSPEQRQRYFQMRQEYTDVVLLHSPRARRMIADAVEAAGRPLSDEEAADVWRRICSLTD